jgi:hypothetical protein
MIRQRKVTLKILQMIKATMKMFHSEKGSIKHEFYSTGYE